MPVFLISLSLKIARACVYLRVILNLNVLLMRLKHFLLSAFLLSALAGGVQAQHTQVIAHRGFWDTTGSAQNSIAALQKADSIGCYGSEFDVWLTSDNQLVVNHDDTFQGVTFQEARAEECTALRLGNGERVPTLRQYLEAAGRLKTRLILELKPHKTAGQETRAIEGIVRMVNELGVEARTEYITFSAHAAREFVRLAPKGTPVYYLNGDAAPRELKAWGCAGADYHIDVFRKHPEWIKECHDLGMKVNVWTVNGEDDMRWLIGQRVDFITTNAPVRLQKVLGEVAALE